MLLHAKLKWILSLLASSPSGLPFRLASLADSCIWRNGELAWWLTNLLHHFTKPTQHDSFSILLVPLSGSDLLYLLSLLWDYSKCHTYWICFPRENATKQWNLFLHKIIFTTKSKYEVSSLLCVSSSHVESVRLVSTVKARWGTCMCNMQ